MIVCVCEGISDREIRAHIASGVSDVDGLERRCGAGGCCGQCRDMLKCIVASDADAGPGDNVALRLAQQTPAV